MIVASICLSDIPVSSITISEKNKKKYLSIVIDERKDPDNYGNTHSVSINMSKEDRQNGVQKVYIGSGKQYLFNKQENKETNTAMERNSQSAQADDSMDLPF